MALESVTYISDLVATNPVGATDQKSQGDDHLRAIKTGILASFPNITGAMSMTHTQLNNAAIKSEVNIFIKSPVTSITPQILLKNAVAMIAWSEDGATADEGVWDVIAFADKFTMRSATDLGAGNQKFLEATRSGVNIATVGLFVKAGETALLATADGAVDLYHNNIKVLATAASGIINVHSATSTDTENRQISLVHQDGTLRGTMGHSAGTDVLLLNNRIHGGNISLTVEDAGGVGRTGLTIDPDALTTLYGDTNIELKVKAGAELGIKIIADAAVELYYNNIKTLATTSPGGVIVHSTDSGDTSWRRILFAHQDGSTRGYMGHENSDLMTVFNQIHSGHVVLKGEDAAGTSREFFRGDPDALTTVSADTDLALKVKAGAENALYATADSWVRLYHNNIARLETGAAGILALLSDGSTDSEARQISFQHADGTQRGVIGHGASNIFEFLNNINGGTFRFRTQDDGGTKRTWLFSDGDALTILASPSGTGVQICNSGEALGFYGATPAVKQTVTGARDANAALADLLTELAQLGLITDSTTQS